MPIPFRDLREDDGLGLAGYLRFITEEDGLGIRGALFVVNGRSEPIDFAFSRVDVSPSFLWRAGEAKRHAVASLAAKLFEACPKAPSLLLALCGEVHPRVFTEDLFLDVPICRLADTDEVPRALNETPENLPGQVHLFWVVKPPEDGSPGRRLLEALQARDMLNEPFDRAARGIEEAFRG